jgi:hypothetical protein
MTERLALRALEHVSAWCVSDTAACKQLSTASNLLWRASLLARAAGGPSEGGGARLLGALAPFPRLAPRLQRAHVATALSLLAGLQSRDGAMGELQAAAERLAGVAGEAGGGGGGGGAGLLLRLRQAVAGATGARLQACLEAAAVRAALAAEEGAAGGEGGGGGGAEAELPPGAALAAAAAKLEALAREWEASALLRALAAREEEGGLRALEGAVWAATGGARTLRAAVDV